MAHHCQRVAIAALWQWAWEHIMTSIGAAALRKDIYRIIA